MVVDAFARRIGDGGGKSRFRSEIVEGTADGEKIVLVKPQTYMNLSGHAVREVIRWYRASLSDVLVVLDELDLPFGTLRLKRGGGEGGHNGLRSMSKSLGSRDYVRVRFGIGRPPGRQDPADFVLSTFASAENKELDYLVDRAADAVEAVVVTGLEPAQNVYHAS